MLPHGVKLGRTRSETEILRTRSAEPQQSRAANFAVARGVKYMFNGLHINDKSILAPVRDITWLGKHHLSASTTHYRPSRVGLSRIQPWYLRTQRYTFKAFRRLLGSMQWLCTPASPHAPPSRRVYTFLFSAHLPRNLFTSRVRNSELLCWLDSPEACPSTHDAHGIRGCSALAPGCFRGFFATVVSVGSRWGTLPPRQTLHTAPLYKPLP